MSEILKPCAIGKMVVITPDEFEWRVPHLHLAVYRQEEGLFCTNIEMSLTAFGNSIDQAVKNTADVTLQYLNQYVLTPEGYDALIKLVDDNVMDDIWRDYRVADFQLGRIRQDMSDTLTETYQRIIRELHEQLEKQDKFDIEDLEFQEIPIAAAA